MIFTNSVKYKQIKHLVPTEYQKPLFVNLEQAGDKRAGELIDAILNAPEEQREAVIFLISYMPRVDLVKVSKEFLLENVRLAYLTKEKFPWGESISKEEFFHYVLPYRIAQEPLENWRTYLLNEMMPDLDTVTTATQAAIIANKCCGERVKFKQTQREDQGVLQTIRSGNGRCEEMMIVYVATLRAIGIPARQAWTPYWATGDNNHAWTEVWADGSWHYTGSCEPRPSLNDAWFNKSVKRAAVVLSTTYGKMEDSDEIVYKSFDRFTITNSTPNYTDPYELDILVNIDTFPAESIGVYISVFNWGALRSILGKQTDEEGKVKFYLNEGTYFLSAGNKYLKSFEIIELKSDTTFTLDLKERDIPDRYFWMRYKSLEEL